MNNDLLKYAYSLDDFEKNALDVIKMITTNLKDHRSKKTVEYQSPEDEFNFWQKEFSSTNQANLIDILENVRKTSMNFHSNGYLGHQVAILPPITILTSAFITYLNNPIAAYEVGAYDRVDSSDSNSLDFHKMMLAPPLSTALLYNKKK